MSSSSESFFVALAIVPEVALLAADVTIRPICENDAGNGNEGRHRTQVKNINIAHMQ